MDYHSIYPGKKHARHALATTILALTTLAAACNSDTDSPQAMPTFEDYPASDIFTGTPAEVDLASHPDAGMFRTRLTEVPGFDARFAGHYRIVQIGCGTACQGIWVIDLVDGSVQFVGTTSSGVAYRADSRLIVLNDPAFFEEMLETSTIAQVEEYMETYGKPEYWLEVDGEFEVIGPEATRD